MCVESPDVVAGGSTTSPRVALCFGTYPPERNGGADFIARFASALGRAGSEVTVVTSPAADADEVEQVDERVTVYRIVDDWSLLRGRHLLRHASRLVRRRADVLHVFFPDSVVQASYQLPGIIGLGRVPLVTTFWNLGLGRRSSLPIRLEALGLLARSAVVTSHDPAYLAVLRRLAGWRRPVGWLPVGNNLGLPASAEADEVRRRHGLDGRPLLAYFGALDETRGLEELVPAFAELRRSVDAQLVMVGSAARAHRYLADEQGAAAYTRYTELPAQHGVDDAVTWTDYLPDDETAALLAAADVCVLPYRRNSLGRSALAAALELGVPVILAGTNEGIAPLRDGKHVARVAPRNASALAGTLDRVLSDDAERARLADGARRAATWFAWDRIAAAATSHYALARR